MKQNPKRITEVVEFEIIKLLSHIFGKTRTNRGNMRHIVNLKIRFLYRDLGLEVHLSSVLNLQIECFSQKLQSRIFFNHLSVFFFRSKGSFHLNGFVYGYFYSNRMVF